MIGMIREPAQQGLACERREGKERKSDNFSTNFCVILFSYKDQQTSSF